MTSSFRLMGNWDARCWIHQATFSRWLRPRAPTTWDCTGATSSLALSEPNGAPTIGSPSAAWPPVSPSAFRSPCRLACLIPGQPRARLGEPASHVLVIQAHMRHLYQKLGAHRRSVAVEQARALGLL